MVNLGKVLIVILIICLITFPIVWLVIGSYAVVNDNMIPLMQTGDRLLVNKMAYHFNEPERGDIVVYKAGEGMVELIARVIGVAGDIIEIQDNMVFINGVNLNEPYSKDRKAYDISEFEVPDNSLFVLDDNYNSNEVPLDWTVPRENIIGRAWTLTWPPEKWGSTLNYPINQQLAISTSP